MTAAVAVFPRPAAAVTGLAVRQVHRSMLVVTVASTGMSALVAGTYRSTVAGNLDSSSFAALAANPAIRTLFGEPAALDTPGGFTVWRTGTVVAVLVGVWGLLAATRLTRGEEDAGRWDLLLAGRLPIAAVVARQLAVLVAAMALIGAAVAAALLATGTDAAGAVLHGVGIAALGVFFVGAGGLAGQVFPARPAASGAAVALLGAGLLARMVGDGVAALSWLRWLSPFGLLELSRPYAADRWTPVLLLAVAATALVLAASAAAAGRDLRGGWLTPGGGAGAAAGAARLGARVRGAPAAAPPARLVAGGRRVLPADRVDRGVDDRLPGRQIPGSPSLPRRPGSPASVRSKATSARCSRCSRSRSGCSPPCGSPASPPTRPAGG